MKTYSPEEVSIIIGGSIIKGWETVTVSRDEDEWSFVAGTDGESTRTKNANKLGMFELVMSQSSEDNLVLSSFSVSGSLLNSAIKDNSGNSLHVIPAATIVKPADAEYGKEAGNRTWQAKGDLSVHVVGGNS